MNAPESTYTQVAWPAKVNEIPKDIFDREDVYQLELEKIFYGPEWHAVAHAGEIPNPGDFKTINVGERPILVVRGDDGEIRTFYNACSHRGNLLETRVTGNAAEFECPYHRWLFDTRGALRGAPGDEDFSPSFCKEEMGVPTIRSTEYLGLIFVTCSDETPDIETYLGRTKDALAITLNGDGRLKLLGYQKVLYDVNWKAYADNDGYHAPLLHAAFKLLNWQGGEGEQYGTENGHIGFESELKVPEDTGFLNDPTLLHFKGTESSKGSAIASIFPVTVITKHMDMINIRFAFPRGVGSTEVHYGYFAHVDDDEEMVRHRIRQSSNMLGPTGLVSMEDASIFSRIHRGNHTPGNVAFQKGVKHEDRIWYDFKQNDEAGNLPRWEHYRKSMGFNREEA
jgi:anthranilate 1,2-dioxygenase large subunit